MSKEELNLDYQAAYDVWKSTMKEGNYLLAVKSALEKQIPKKSKTINPHYTHNFIFGCHSCNEPVKFNQKYCAYCGQLIDWSEIE